MVDGEEYEGNPGLWELLVSKIPDDSIYTHKDYENYARLMLKTNNIHRDNDPKSINLKSSKSFKWKKLLSPIWKDRKEYEGSRVVVIPSDPNTLLGRLDH